MMYFGDRTSWNQQVDRALRAPHTNGITHCKCKAAKCGTASVPAITVIVFALVRTDKIKHHDAQQGIHHFP